METRGERNNNPLNIRISGDKFQGEVIPSTDKSFKQFETAAYGYRAAFRILKTYYNNYGLHTIEGLINRWAPTNENHTANYIKAVSGRAGIPKDKEILFVKSVMIPIAAAMCYVENGKDANMNDIESGWEML